MKKINWIIGVFLAVVLVAGAGLADAATRIMPLGDSITKGIGSSGLSDNGYRRPLFHSLTDAGYDIAFVGSMEDGYPFDFDRFHEGHPRKAAGWIASQVATYLQEHPADIVLLHIGTNDILSGTSTNTIVTAVEDILDEIDTVSPNAVVVLARITNRVPFDETITQLNDQIAAMAMGRIAAGDDIVVVDMENDAHLDYRFEADGGDIVDDAQDAHPNDLGYEKMAQVWYQALEGLLGPPCFADLPTPHLAYKGSEDYLVRGQWFTRYKLEITNWDSFPEELFLPAPYLPPCGLNYNASRTWIRIYDMFHRRLYGFCALTSPEGLRQIWFARPKGQAPPWRVYVKLVDRACDQEYRSNSVWMRLKTGIIDLEPIPMIPYQKP